MDEEYKQKIDKMHTVMFGDKESNTKGMVDKVDIIFDVFMKVENGFTFMKWIIGAILVLGLLVGTIKGWVIALAHWSISRN